MKIRMSYVSNSSSSSFVVIGEDITAGMVSDTLLSNEVIAVGENMGTSGENEDYIVLLTPERWDIIKNSNLKCKLQFIKVNFSTVTPDSEKNDILAEVKGKTWFFNKDYSSPQTSDELKKYIQERCR